jgi:hypothetical protein
MAIDVHAVELIANSQLNQPDRVLVGLQIGVANLAGSGAGASVVTAVTFAAGALPSSYAVIVTPAQDATSFVTNKTANGFNVTLTPRLASATLAASSFDVVVIA